MDVFKPFLQRLSQPILLSFCIAWIFWNWEIVVALCWYDAKTIEKLGYKNHIEYIDTMKDHWRNYFWPLIIALLYPISILILNNFHTFFKMLEEKLFTKIVKNATVPTELYLNAQDQIEVKEKRISKFIALETKMEGTINDLIIDNKDLNNKLSLLNDEFIETSNIKTSFENRLKEVDRKIEYYTTKSSIEFLEGSYDLELLKRIGGGQLSTLFSGTINIKKNENEEKYAIYLVFNKYEFISEIIEYYYNLVNDIIIIKTKLITDSSFTVVEFENDTLSVIERELLNGLIELPQMISEKIMFSKDIKFGNSDLRLDLIKHKDF